MKCSKVLRSIRRTEHAQLDPNAPTPTWFSSGWTKRGDPLCLVHRKGEIIEGAEDDIRATYYMMAFQREFNDSEAELRWKVVDMAVVGGERHFARLTAGLRGRAPTVLSKRCLRVLRA